MRVAFKVFIVIVLAWHSGVSSSNVQHFNAPPGKRPTIKDCKQLSGKKIDCRNLGFQNVPYDIFSVRDVKIYLSQNPYICDCSLIWFLQEPTTNKKRIIDYNNMKCISPTKMKGTLVKGIKGENSICKTKQPRLSSHCRNLAYFWLCARNKIFRCGCDTVWLIRGLKRGYVKGILPVYKPFFCKADKAKGVSKPVPIGKATEAQFCPQKENDPCKGDPCPGHMTVCKYTAKSYVCRDVNECLKSPCKKSEVCVNKIKTGYQCVCSKDFIRDKASKKCIHRDPCKRRKSLCPSIFEECETVKLSSGLSYRCVDFDECLAGSHTCGEAEDCYNKENGYECRCMPGFKREKDKCVDIDECLTGTYTCAEGEECRNKRNGYDCRCMPGLTREGDKCVAKVDPCKAKSPVCNPRTERCVSENWESYECLDVNECDTQQHDCDVNANCINANPGYKCQCKPGFKEYKNGRKCVDLNECSNKFSCAKHAKCINVPGSYKCECNSGYSGDGKYCNDINECNLSKTKCPVTSKCRYTPGSYTCKCVHGFRLKNKRCVDVDECKTSSHNCDENALCTNTVGSYTCRCKDGFKDLKHGRQCLREVYPEETSKGSNTSIIIVAVFASVFLVILICGGAYCQRKKMKSKQNTGGEESQVLLEKK